MGMLVPSKRQALGSFLSWNFDVWLPSSTYKQLFKGDISRNPTEIESY